MRKFYEDLKKIEDFSNFNRSELLDYIHRQKFEAAAICGIDAKFWVELDYLIQLTLLCASNDSNEKRNFFINYVIPVITSKISEIDAILKHLPEKEFFYLKKDLRLFKHIFSHSSNLRGKKLDYFIPFPLFSSAIKTMTVLYPLCDKTCDIGTLARKNYTILLTRYVANDFSSKIVEIIDFFIWVLAVSRIAPENDIKHFREEIVRKLSDFTESESVFNSSEDYSAKTFVLELHEVLTEINIKNSIRELLDKILTVQISIGECLKTISSIFLDIEKIPGQSYVLRDLTVVTDLASSVVANMKNGSNRALYEDIYLAKALKPYFMQVSRYMLDAANDIEICRFFEIMYYVEETFPSFVMHNSIIPLLEKSIAIFEHQKSILPNAEDIGFAKESAELFKAKAKQIYAGKI
ncbi:hypothetical protein J6Z19_05320 [bacterium]|nr:hypothetical protein [bacterium]